MSERPRWLQMAGSVAFVALMSLTMSWLDRARRKRTPDDASLPYPWGAKIAALICAPVFPALNVFVLAMGLAGADGDRSTLDAGVAIACLPVSWLFIWWALESWVTRFRLMPDGLSYRSLYGRSGMIHWKDVAEVRLTIWGAFRIHTRDRRIVRVSTSRRGLHLLAAEILAKVARDRIDDHTFESLEETAAGSPPPLS